MPWLSSAGLLSTCERTVRANALDCRPSRVTCRRQAIVSSSSGLPTDADILPGLQRSADRLDQLEAGWFAVGELRLTSARWLLPAGKLVDSVSG